MAITDVKFQSTDNTDQTNVPVTFGQVFAAGDVSQSYTITGELSDGTVVPLQVDVKASHSDRSIRHAVISALIPKLSSQSRVQPQTLRLIKTPVTSASQKPMRPTDLLNAGFTAGVRLLLGGQTYSASADALLRDGKYTTWLAGPIANEWLISAPLKTDQGVNHPHLMARFAIRSYTGVNKARVDVSIENVWAYEPSPQNFTYDVQILVGGQTVYAKSALTHYDHARWRKVFWWGATPQVHIRHDTAYLIATKALANYDQSIIFSASAIDSNVRKFTGAVTEPMHTGLAQPSMPDTGGRPDIGLLPGWAVTYLLTMDKAAKEATLGTADLAGSWAAHYRDKKTDRPVSVVDYPYISVNDPNSGDTINPATKKNERVAQCVSTDACSNPNIIDPAHQPSFAYLPYIVTGDHYYLEELQFWAMWNVIQGVPGYRNFAKGLIHQTQVRGQAWMLRSIAEAAYITPDSDLLKKQFETLLSDNLDWYNRAYTNNPAADNRLGFITEHAIEYNNKIGVAPWMDDFFTSAVGHIAELGYVKAKPLLAWKVTFPISRMTDPNFCWIVGASYSLVVRDSPASPIYTSMRQVYDASNPASLRSLACAGGDMAHNLSLKVGEMTGYSTATDGMPLVMQPALAYAADSGSAAAAAAWKVFVARSVKPDFSKGPQFAIVPR
ncbi:MAG: hypothetical protein JWQ10_1719 [Herbaspirillum sp.]|jgi:hypothetical protein|nr:hypothetical protein [Herbaspirillum sp.]